MLIILAVLNAPLRAVVVQFFMRLSGQTGKLSHTAIAVHKKNIEVQRPPKGVPGKLTALISEIALDAFNVVGCSDYGRAEVRIDAKGNPYVLEINPNPSIGPTDCVPSVAALAGMEYGDFLEEILRLAIRRYKDKPPYYHLQMTTL